MRKSLGADKLEAANSGAKGKDPLDVHVGRRLRRRRIFVGLNQTQLGEAVGVSFQQV